MKKNRMMRLASVLLVLTLLTTSVISGTFAKYVTTDQHQDTARVAKFGVVATVSGDLFGATYLSANEDDVITAWASSTETVSSDAATNYVVAPGTGNTKGLNLFITGTPEVSTKVFFDAAEDKDGKPYADCEIYLTEGTYGVMVKYEGTVTADTVGNYYELADGVYSQAKDPTAENLYELHDVVAATAYKPLNWTYTVGSEAPVTTKDLEEVKTELDTYFNAGKFVPNASNAMNANVTWDWDFGTERGEDEEIELEDQMDTILGDMMTAQLDKTVQVVKLVGTNYVTVQYAEVDVVENVSANKKVVAKVGDDVVACLTVAFNARLTVEQVD